MSHRGLAAIAGTLAALRGLTKDPLREPYEQRCRELYCELQGYVKALAWSVLGATPPAELIHDLSAEVVLSLSRFGGSCDWDYWVHTIVLRQIAKWRRTELRRRCLLRELRSRTVPEEVIRPDEAAEARALIVRLRHWLGRLPERERVCFLQVHFERASVRAVADRLCVGPDAVRVNIWRARQRLRTYLSAGPDDSSLDQTRGSGQARARLEDAAGGRSDPGGRAARCHPRS